MGITGMKKGIRDPFVLHYILCMSEIETWDIPEYPLLLQRGQ